MTGTRIAATTEALFESPTPVEGTALEAETQPRAPIDLLTVKSVPSCEVDEEDARVIEEEVRSDAKKPPLQLAETSGSSNGSDHNQRKQPFCPPTWEMCGAREEGTMREAEPGMGCTEEVIMGIQDGEKERQESPLPSLGALQPAHIDVHYVAEMCLEQCTHLSFQDLVALSDQPNTLVEVDQEQVTKPSFGQEAVKERAVVIPLEHISSGSAVASNQLLQTTTPPEAAKEAMGQGIIEISDATLDLVEAPSVIQCTQISTSPSGSFVAMKMMEEAIAGEIQCKSEMPSIDVHKSTEVPETTQHRGLGSRRLPAPGEAAIKDEGEPQQDTNVSQNTTSQRSGTSKARNRIATRRRVVAPFAMGTGRTVFVPIKGPERVEAPIHVSKRRSQLSDYPVQVGTRAVSTRFISQRHTELTKEMNRMQRMRTNSQERARHFLQSEARKEPEGSTVPEPISSAPKVTTKATQMLQTAAPAPPTAASCATAGHSQQEDGMAKMVVRSMEAAVAASSSQSMSEMVVSFADLHFEEGEPHFRSAGPLPSPILDDFHLQLPPGLQVGRCLERRFVPQAPSRHVGRTRQLWMERLTGFRGRTPARNAPTSASHDETDYLPPTKDSGPCGCGLLCNECNVDGSEALPPFPSPPSPTRLHERRKHNRNLISVMVDRFGQRQDMLNGLYHELLPSCSPCQQANQQVMHECDTGAGVRSTTFSLQPSPILSQNSQLGLVLYQEISTALCVTTDDVVKIT
eukprot:GGOE01000091.1.p1 GENE.GGOE01000091.1~~GGOE01000091.1.p1  ORF type:complete len:810 (-),score=113.90 GGOE01000091.1:106-2337(-)